MRLSVIRTVSLRAGPGRGRHHQLVALAAAVVIVAGCSSGGAVSTGSGGANGSVTLKVAYGVDYVFDTTALAKQWWGEVGTDFKATHPNVTIVWEPIAGSYNDTVNKLSLLYKSSSTAPDIAEIPSGQIGVWAQSGYLLPMNPYLGKTDWGSTFPAVVQSEGTFNSNVYRSEE